MSVPPDIRYFPEGLNFITDTSPSCPFSSIDSASGGRVGLNSGPVSQNRILPDFDPVARMVPIGYIYFEKYLILKLEIDI